MSNIRSQLHLSWFGVISAILIGTALGYFSSVYNWVDEVSFYIRPVVAMHGEIVGRKDGVQVRITGKKLRGTECVYLGMQAFGVRPVGPLVDLYIQRSDMPEDGKTRPAGEYDIGIWRIWPTDTISNVVVYVSHKCGGTYRSTKIAEVRL